MKTLLEAVKTLVGNAILLGLYMGLFLLLFANLRFDIAAIVFGLVNLGILIFIYWPRSK